MALDRPHIAIIGAGPIGLEAALYAVQRGYRVSVFERGRVAENVRRWGHVRLFSPFGMNSSEWGRAALRESGHELPADDELLTGQEFVARYLFPLSRLDELESSTWLSDPVVAVGRKGILKTEFIGSPERSRHPFLLYVYGDDRIVEADVVLDCSGTFRNPNRLGSGGIPCLGEPSGLTGDSGYGAPNLIDYGLPDVAGAHHDSYAGKHVLVVGSGHSAATSVVALAGLAGSAPETRVTWITRRRESKPMSRITGDQLPARDELNFVANSLATDPASPVDWIPGAAIREIRFGRDQVHVSLEISAGETVSEARFDRIIANVGYRPDRSIYEELQVHECYATQGPMKLAAKLLGESSGDCLDQTSHGPDALRNPEPSFFVLGAKSYGRRSNFLIRVGLQQIIEVFKLIERDLSAPSKQDG